MAPQTFAQAGLVLAGLVAYNPAVGDTVTNRLGVCSII